ncbi:MAG TPA: hypothetical protein PK528_05025, partial [Syntrophorhabdus sp.]|nr:hypothetical protein [Syntrophorhabdus sp.]
MPHIHWKVVAYMRSLRETYPGIGKEKIKPLLDAYCEKEGLKTISISSIGNTMDGIICSSIPHRRFTMIP